MKLALIALGWFMFAATPAFGQVAVSDALVENSVTELGGAGTFQSQSGWLANNNTKLNPGIGSSAIFNKTFPGWVPLPTHAISVSKLMTVLGLNTYSGAMAIAQQHLTDLPTEDAGLSGIRQENEAELGVLPALRLIESTLVMGIQHDERIEQLLATLVIVESVDHGENLQQLAHVGATTARSENGGIEP